MKNINDNEYKEDNNIDTTVDTNNNGIDNETEEIEINEEQTENNDNEDNIIEGVGIVFNQLSEDLGGFREIIMPEAINDEVIKNSDIYYRFNHSEDNAMVLARANKGIGSLLLSLMNDGLHYRFNCIDEKIYKTIKRGDITNASFAFETPKDGSGEMWIKSLDYNYIRKITKIERLHDISCVLHPAYNGATVYARSKNNIQEVDQAYYDEYQNIINILTK